MYLLVRFSVIVPPPPYTDRYLVEQSSPSATRQTEICNGNSKPSTIERCDENCSNNSSSTECRQQYSSSPERFPLASQKRNTKLHTGLLVPSAYAFHLNFLELSTV